jgi:hypothetical protein
MTQAQKTIPLQFFTDLRAALKCGGAGTGGIGSFLMGRQNRTEADGLLLLGAPSGL